MPGVGGLAEGDHGDDGPDEGEHGDDRRCGQHGAQGAGASPPDGGVGGAQFELRLTLRGGLRKGLPFLLGAGRRRCLVLFGAALVFFGLEFGLVAAALFGEALILKL